MSDKESKWQKFAEKTTSKETGEEKSNEEFHEEIDKKKGAKNKETGALDYPSRTELENQLTAMEMKVAEYKEQLARTRAETENIHKRAERRISQAHQFGVEEMVKELLPVRESMLRGLDSVKPTDPATKSVYEGMKLTLELLTKALQKHGVEVIDPKKGEAFNPEQHEAMSMISDPSAKPHTIIETMERGYALNGRVLKAAMVIVAK